MPLTVKDLAPVCGHHIFTDALFVQGYNLLVNGDLSGQRVLEICSGEGDLSGWLGQMTTAEVVGIEGSEESVLIAKKKYGDLPNVTFLCGDAMNLSGFESESFDIIVGQAAMHHLASNLTHVSKEFSRVLKPGGRLLFIFEPLGHNPIVAAIRAIHNSRAEWVDESNLFEWVLRDFASNFSRYEVYYFSLFAYFCKALPKQSRVARQIYRYCSDWDRKMFQRWPRARKYAANFNVCYWK